MEITIHDQKGNKIFQMVFAFEVDDIDFVPKLIKFMKKHKIEKKKGE